MAIFTRTELLLIILGGLLVIEVMSVILQVGFFKITKGRRLFKMSPIHHHFELLNWAQVTIDEILDHCGLFVAGGLGIFYAEWWPEREHGRRRDSGPPDRGGDMTRLSWLPEADGASAWQDAHVLVAGVGVSGIAARTGCFSPGPRSSSTNVTTRPTPTRGRSGGARRHRAAGSGRGGRATARCRPGHHDGVAP